MVGLVNQFAQCKLLLSNYIIIIIIIILTIILAMHSYAYGSLLDALCHECFEEVIYASPGLDDYIFPSSIYLN